MSDVAGRLRELADAAESAVMSDDLDARFAKDVAMEWIADRGFALARGYADALDALRNAHDYIGTDLEETYDDEPAFATHARAVLAEADRLLGDNT